MGQIQFEYEINNYCSETSKYGIHPNSLKLIAFDVCHGNN